MPGERHSVLNDLSYDHRLFLIEARNIRWLIDGDARSGTTRELVMRLLRFWKLHGRFHLQEEEEVLYPFYIQHVPQEKVAISKLEIDHNWLREKFEELADLPPHENCEPLLRSIGSYMVSHIQKEETEIYEQIQEKLSTQQLEELARKATEFRDENREEDYFAPDDLEMPDTELLNLDFDL